MKTKILLLFILVICISPLVTSVKAQAWAVADPDLEAGFPVQSYHTAGTYQSGAAIHTLVANLDSDPTLEIVATALGTGPLYAWNSDGSLLPGWPQDFGYGAGYPAAGNLVGTSKVQEVVANYFYARLAAYDSSEKPLPGWPKDYWGNGYMPPALADVDQDGFDEIFNEHNDGKLYAYNSDGTVLPGWPVVGTGNQEFHTSAIADIDQDGDLEIFSVDSSGSGANLFAFHHTGSQVSGFPVHFNGFTNTFPAIGDVDGDGKLEVVVVESGVNVLIYSDTGELERTIPVTGNLFYDGICALADLDGDKIPEIVVQTNTHLNVLRGNGTTYPGWPVSFGNPNRYMVMNNAPVVGDVDGDHYPDILVSLAISGSTSEGEVRLYNRDGVQHPHFPKYVNIGTGTVPAIADIDLDGRNEIIVSGSYWDGQTGYFDKLWVFDLSGGPHGKIEWGQFGGGPHHRSVYPVPPPPEPPAQPPAGELIYLTQVFNQTIPPTPEGIQGRVTYDGVGMADVPAELFLYNGVGWVNIQTIATTAGGTFRFTGVPSLASNQAYQVRFINTTNTPGRLGAWFSREISTYRSGNSVGVGNFDIADVQLTSPAYGAVVTLPYKFTWNLRSTSPTDMFSWVIYDPVDFNPAYQDLPYRTDAMVIPHLPSGFSNGVVYAWNAWIVAPDGALGIPNEPRLITFSSQSNKLEQALTGDFGMSGWKDFLAAHCIWCSTDILRGYQYKE